MCEECGCEAPRKILMPRRPARLDLTSTHADVWLGMDQTDLRVRRAGLDLDPGWVPWFGRVVRFHYGPRPR